MFVPLEVLNQHHPTTALYMRTERRFKKQQRLVEEEAQDGDETTFQEYFQTLVKVTSFCYLGQILNATDNNSPEVVRIISKAFQSWAPLSSIPGRERADVCTMGRFYLAIARVNPYFCIGYVVGDPPHWEDPGGVPPPGGAADYWEATTSTIRLDMSLLPIGGVN